MQGYDGDEYEEYDDYEDEEDQGEGGEEEEEYEEEEEDPKPTKEQLEYLELRQKLKESIRRKMQKENGSASQDKKKLPYDNYGSFFGPSKPVIADRVIQESKSLLENRHLASKVLDPHYNNKKSSASTSSGSKPGSRGQVPKVVNEMQKKVQKLKDTRDYSFLLSDDGELPAPKKQTPVQNGSVHGSGARTNVLLPQKRSLGSNGRHIQNGREERRPVSTNNTNSKPLPNKSPGSNSRHIQNGREERRPASASTIPGVNKKQFGSNNGSGPGRPTVPNGLQSKKPVIPADKSAIANSSGPGRPTVPNGSQYKKPVVLADKTAVANGKSQKPAPSKTVISPKTPFQRPPVAKLQSLAPKHQLEHGRQVQEHRKSKIPPKQQVTSMKPQSHPQTKKPLKPIQSHINSHVQKPKKRPSRPFSDNEDDEDDMAISMIRKMFGYNPDKFAGCEEDDSDMEANFDEIMKEEKRSARIAREEDEEQLRLIEEEERREHMKKLAKKRKLSQY